jgi:LuxR family maltose regulon positive regulatory protein
MRSPGAARACFFAGSGAARFEWVMKPQQQAGIAKVSRPIPTGVFERIRLFDLLDSFRERPVVYVTGPGGCGKTTLVSSYVAARGFPCLWYQVDASDEDPATFFYYLGLAARKAAPRRRKPFPLLTPEYLLGIETFTLRYFENLYACLKVPSVLVFDRYQSVPADSSFHDLLRSALSNMPRGLNVIFVSRSDPPPALARMHANRLLGILGWPDLRLTLDESEGIAELITGRRHSKETILRLHEASDGWAAGLVLLLERTERERIHPQLLGKLGREEIFDYFAHEIFAQLDKETQEFLLKTALPPRVTPRMAEELTGLSHAGRILSGLYRNNHFTERHFRAEPVYQYHALFREFLLSMATHAFTPERLSSLRRRAAMLLEDAGETEAGFSLHRDAGDLGAMARLVMKHAPTLLAQGRHRSLLAWLESFPEQVTAGNPWLLYWRGVSLLPVDAVEAERRSEEAYRIFKKENDAAGVALSWANAVIAILNQLRSADRMDRWIEELDEVLKQSDACVSTDIEMQVAISVIIALSIRQPTHGALPEWEKRAHLLLQRSSDTNHRIMLGSQLVHYYTLTGELPKAAVIVEIVRPLLTRQEVTPLAMIWWSFFEGIYRWLVGPADTSLGMSEKALARGQASGIHIFDPVLFQHAARCALSSGDLASARKYLGKLSLLLHPSDSYGVWNYHYLAAWESWLRDDLPRALEHAQAAQKVAPDVGWPFATARSHGATGCLLFESGKHREAFTHLRKAEGIGREVKSHYILYVCLLIRCHFAFDSDRVEQGLKYLRKGMSLGRTKGFVNMEWIRPSTMASLCVKALEAGIEVDYVQEIVRKRKLTLDTPPVHLESWPWRLKVFTLGRFSILREGEPVRFSRKAQEKPLSMLKMLIALGGKGVREGQVSDFLWPEADGDVAHGSFATTLHRLRTLIGSHEAIELQAGCLTLNPGSCWVDAWALEGILGEAEKGWRKVGGSNDAAVPIRLTLRAIDLYKGPFLVSEMDEPWAAALRERLGTRFLRVAERLGEYWENTGHPERAVGLYRRSLEAEDLAEELYRRLMLCLKRLGRTAEAVRVYSRCKRTLSGAGRELSRETGALGASLLSELGRRR